MLCHAKLGRRSGATISEQPASGVGVCGKLHVINEHESVLPCLPVVVRNLCNRTRQKFMEWFMGSRLILVPDSRSTAPSQALLRCFGVSILRCVAFANMPHTTKQNL